MKLIKSGLPIYLDEATHKLSFKDGLSCEESNEKSTAKLANVLMNPDSGSEDISFDFYKRVQFEKDAAIFKEKKLRFDITVIHPGKIGRERKKTTGHIHVNIAGKNTPHAELYEVLSGTALYILQPSDSKSVMAVKIHEGERIIVPANCAHCTVNIGAEALVFDNLVLDAGKNDYGIISQNHGMAIYVIQEEGKIKMVPNDNYGKIEYLNATNNTSEKFGTIGGKSRAVYLDFVLNPKIYSYLADPTDYNTEISGLLNTRTMEF